MSYVQRGEPVQTTTAFTTCVIGVIEAVRNQSVREAQGHSILDRRSQTHRLPRPSQRLGNLLAWLRIHR